MRKKIIKIIKKEMTCNSHSIEHISRVYNLCMEIAKSEKNVDYEVLEIAALLHDIGREKENKDTTGVVDHAIEGAKMAQDILAKLNFSKINEVQHCILAHRKRTDVIPQTIEAKILFDADKIDCLGAVGIARNFMFAGQHGQKLTMDYQIPQKIYVNDVSKHNPILEYDIALKHISKHLYTKTGRKIAAERQKFLNLYFEKLKKELTLSKDITKI